MRRALPWRALPRTRTLCKLLAGLVALTVIFHAASCGFFFCIRFPRALEFPHDMYNDIRDIYVLAGKPSGSFLLCAQYQPLLLGLHLLPAQSFKGVTVRRT